MTRACLDLYINNSKLVVSACEVGKINDLEPHNVTLRVSLWFYALLYD